MRHDFTLRYKRTTKEERIALRREFAKIVRTKEYGKWLLQQFKRQHGECFYCDDLISLSDRGSYNIEHRLSIYRGGTNDFGNLVIACPECNRVKGVEMLVRNKAFLNRINQSRARRGLEPRLYT